LLQWFFWASSLGDTLDQLLAEFVYNFLAMPHIGLLALRSILVPELTAPHVFEPKALACPFNKFNESLRVAIHKRYGMRPRLPNDKNSDRRRSQTSFEVPWPAAVVATTIAITGSTTAS
jgi:hypothetical protein